MKMNQSTLESWYNQVARCALFSNETSDMEMHEAHFFCKSKFRSINSNIRSVGSDIHFLPAHNMTGCPRRDMPLRERGFDEVIPGYEDATATPLLKMFEILSTSNRSLILMGDSTMRQLYYAFMFEARRESHRMEFNCGIDGEQFTKNTLGVTLTSKVFSHICVWTPPVRGPQSNPVTVYHLSEKEHFVPSAVILEEVIPALGNKVHPAGLVLITNIGKRHHVI